MSWYLYIIETEKDKLYTGIATDVERRFVEHLIGIGAKYFRSDEPRRIVYCEVFKNRSEASIREAAIKKLSKKEKLFLISSF